MKEDGFEFTPKEKHRTAILTATFYGIPHDRAWSLRDRLYAELKRQGFSYNKGELNYVPWQRLDDNLHWYYKRGHKHGMG